MLNYDIIQKCMLTFCEQLTLSWVCLLTKMCEIISIVLDLLGFFKFHINANYSKLFTPLASLFR